MTNGCGDALPQLSKGTRKVGSTSLNEVTSMPLISALQRQRQVNLWEREASLVHRGSRETTCQNKKLLP